MRLLRVAALATATLAVAACTRNDNELPDAIPYIRPNYTTTTSSPPPPTDAEANCGNPVASFAPIPLPAPGQMPAGSTMATIQRRGRLIAGVSADTKLFGARNAFTGALEGFDIDILREVSRAIFGSPDKIEYHVIPYSQRLPALEAGTVDIVAHTMTINCVRWARINFSSEYFRAGQKVLVKSTSPATRVEDLGGARVCAAIGSTNIDNIAKYPTIEAVGQVDLTDCLVLFQQGKVDAITGDDTVLAGFVAQDPYAKVVGPQFTQEPYGLGVAKKQVDLVRFVNAVLERVRADGAWRRIYERWLAGLGATPPPPPAVYGRAP